MQWVIAIALLVVAAGRGGGIALQVPMYLLLAGVVAILLLFAFGPTQQALRRLCVLCHSMSTMIAPRKRKPEPPSQPWWKRPWPIVNTSLGTIAALSGLYLFFSSTVSITASDPLNQEALSSPFTVTNTSQFLTLYNVSPSCYIKGEKYNDGVVLGNDSHTHYADKIPELGPGGTDTVYCEAFPFQFAPGHGVTVNADVMLVIDYTSLFHRKDEKFRFVTRTKSDGKLQWVPYGIKDVDPDFQQKP